ncbi:MAG TPA: hypothetical protein VGM50_18905 [Gemmatimonadaceae bacterium]|jgi:hypothetical protein
MRAKFTLFGIAVAAIAATSSVGLAQDPIVCHNCMRRSSDDGRYQALAERLQRQSERTADQVARSAERMSTELASRISTRAGDAMRERAWDRMDDGNTLRTVYHWDGYSDRDSERAREHAERAIERARDRTERALERAQRARDRTFDRIRWNR